MDVPRPGSRAGGMVRSVWAMTKGMGFIRYAMTSMCCVVPSRSHECSRDVFRKADSLTVSFLPCLKMTLLRVPAVVEPNPHYLHRARPSRTMRDPRRRWVPC